jgi:pilus assembly protein CpaC
MRIDVRKSRVAIRIGWAGFLVAAAILGIASSAGAGGDVRENSHVMIGNAESTHNSVIKLTERDGLPQTRSVRLGRNKAMMIEMPRELRDVMVSAPEIMDAVVQSSNRVHLIGKKTGQSNAFFFDANGEQILTLEVTVEYDTSALDSLFQRLLPGSNIKSEVLNETVVLTGSVRNPLDATRATDIASRFIVQPDASGDTRSTAKVINMLSVEAEEQVMLKVTVAEVQREVLKQFGINLGAVINSGNFTTAILSDNALPLTAAAGLGPLPRIGLRTIGENAGLPGIFNPGPPGVGSPVANSGAAGTWSSGGSVVASAIRAMERDGLIKTLAEPNLTAISGESAKFLAGGEFPVPVVDTQGAISVMYKEYGVGVAFTPVVLSEGRISLKIETEVSELTNIGSVTLSNLNIPALKKRQAKSTVELPSGGSLALAGLIQDDVRQNIDGFPGLKDLPVLGTLFRSRDFIKKETELVVIVTPYVVKPVSRQELARPLDGLGEATDMKANFLGHLNRIYGKDSSAAPAGDLKGDYGFIVE